MWFLILVLLTGTVSAAVISQDGEEWVVATSKVKRKDLVDLKQKYIEDKLAIKTSCDSQLADIQTKIDLVKADIDAIDAWKVVVDPAPYNP